MLVNPEPLGDLPLIALHHLCVPLIVWTVFAFLWVIPVPPGIGQPGVWAGLAIVFECLLGFALGRSRADLLAAYDVTSGNLWLLVVVCVGCAPWLAAKLRGIA